MNQRMASSPFKIILLLVLLTPLLALTQQKEGRKKTPGSPLTGKRNERRQGPEILADNPELIWGAPETDRIKGSLIIPDGSTARIEYSIWKQAMSTSAILLQGRGIIPVSVELKGLLPAEKYVYRLFLKRSGEAAYTNAGEGTFYTAKPAGQSFEFTIQGDSHPERVGKMFNPALYRATLDSLTRTGTSFHFLMGDDFNADRLIANGSYTTEQVERIYRLQRSYLGRIGSNPPYFFVNGNHEQAALHWYDGTDTNIAVLATRAKKKLFALADPGTFYSGDTEQVAHIGLLNDYYAF